jgi:signal recognition particle GTPase
MVRGSRVAMSKAQAVRAVAAEQLLSWSEGARNHFVSQVASDSNHISRSNHIHRSIHRIRQFFVAQL